MLALLRLALNSSIFVDHNEFLDELTLCASVSDHNRQTRININFALLNKHLQLTRTKIKS